MIQEKEPKYYEEKLQATEALSQDEVEDYLAEVSSVLLGLEKGLKILDKIGKAHDPVVLENQKRFIEIKNQLIKLVE